MGRKIPKSSALIAAAMLMLSPASALAQEVGDTVADPYGAVEREDDGFDWGLLGLLGLAGLLGLKRREHTHVEPRRDVPPRV